MPLLVLLCMWWPKNTGKIHDLPCITWIGFIYRTEPLCPSLNWKQRLIFSSCYSCTWMWSIQVIQQADSNSNLTTQEAFCLGIMSMYLWAKEEKELSQAVLCLTRSWTCLIVRQWHHLHILICQQPLWPHILGMVHCILAKICKTPCKRNPLKDQICSAYLKAVWLPITG